MKAVLHPDWLMQAVCLIGPIRVELQLRHQTPSTSAYIDSVFGQQHLSFTRVDTRMELTSPFLPVACLLIQDENAENVTYELEPQQWLKCLNIKKLWVSLFKCYTVVENFQLFTCMSFECIDALLLLPICQNIHIVTQNLQQNCNS